MTEPQRPGAGQALEKAADAMEAWRQHQIAALTDAQRGMYEQACRKAEEREKARAQELERRKQADIQERMRKKILEAPRLELILHGKRTKITEVLAQRLTTDYFQPGWQHDFSQFHMMVQQAAKAATAEIEHEHGQNRQAFRDSERGNLDDLLRGCDRAREAKGQNSQEFARAGVKGKAKTGFQRSSRDEAIARAFAKVAQKEEDERQRDDRDMARGRTLSDSFNKSR